MVGEDLTQMGEYSIINCQTLSPLPPSAIVYTLLQIAVPRPHLTRATCLTVNALLTPTLDLGKGYCSNPSYRQASGSRYAEQSITLIPLP